MPTGQEKMKDGWYYRRKVGGLFQFFFHGALGYSTWFAATVGAVPSAANGVCFVPMISDPIYVVFN
jgi:hypothetical protein